jgi:hypothetical protein
MSIKFAVVSYLTSGGTVERQTVFGELCSSAKASIQMRRLGPLYNGGPDASTYDNDILYVVLYDKYDIKYVKQRLRHKVCRTTAT